MMSSLARVATSTKVSQRPVKIRRLLSFQAFKHRADNHSCVVACSLVFPESARPTSPTDARLWPWRRLAMPSHEFQMAMVYGAVLAKEMV